VIVEGVLVFYGFLGLAANADGKLFSHDAIYQISGGEQNESLSRREMACKLEEATRSL
jgi:hypothetical protein